MLLLGSQGVPGRGKVVHVLLCDLIRNGLVLLPGDSHGRELLCVQCLGSLCLSTESVLSPFFTHQNASCAGLIVLVRPAGSLLKSVSEWEGLSSCASSQAAKIPGGVRSYPVLGGICSTGMSCCLIRELGVERSPHIRAAAIALSSTLLVWKARSYSTRSRRTSRRGWA